jgi:hypothetical protein
MGLQRKDFDGLIASVKGLFWLAVIVVAIVMAAQSYDGADHAGLVWHSGAGGPAFAIVWNRLCYTV